VTDDAPAIEMKVEQEKSQASDAGSGLSPNAMDLDQIMENLDEHVQRWGLVTRVARREQRLNSTMRELEGFYTSVAPFMERIIELLNQFPVDAIPERYRPLAFTAFALCEVDGPVSKYLKVRFDQTSDPRHFVGKRSFYDRKIPADFRELRHEMLTYRDEGEGPLVMF